jgi:hypothetical protein
LTRVSSALTSGGEAAGRLPGEYRRFDARVLGGSLEAGIG